MTNFAVQSFAGPVISSVASKDKGSFGNRVDCAGQQLKNNLVTGAQATAVGAGAVGTVYAAAKNEKVATTLARVFDKSADAVGKLFGQKKWSKFLNEAMAKNIAIGKTQNNANLNPETLKNLTKTIKCGKAGILTAAIALMGLSYIGSKHNYKMGQIDQKYTDKAQLQKTL